MWNVFWDAHDFVVKVQKTSISRVESLQDVVFSAMHRISQETCRKPGFDRERLGTRFPRDSACHWIHACHVLPRTKPRSSGSALWLRNLARKTRPTAKRWDSRESVETNTFAKIGGAARSPPRITVKNQLASRNSRFTRTNTRKAPAITATPQKATTKQ
jgi:hypothetical protein